MDLYELEKWIKEVDKKLDNHLIHTASDIAQIKGDLDWIKRFFWLVTGTSIASIVGAMIALVLK